MPCRRRARLALEPLDHRLAPAGLVTATFSGAGLVLTGDAAANDITITQDAQDRLTVTGNGGTAVRLNAGPPQAAVTLPTPVTAGVTVRLRDGADALTFDTAGGPIDLPAFLAVDGGAGGNTVTLTGGSGLTVNGSVSITHGAGLDTLHLADRLTVTGGMSVWNGDGGSLLDDTPAAELRVGGALRVAGGRGPDTLALDEAARVLVGSLAVSTAATGPDAAGSDTEVSPDVGDFTAGSVTVTNGGGFDRVVLGSDGGAFTVAGGLAVANGAGGSQALVYAATTLTLGRLGVANGAGDDVLEVGKLGIPGPAPFHRILGGVTVANGAGDNRAYLGQGSGTTLYVGGAIAVTGGAGPDIVNIGLASDGATLSQDVTVGPVSVRSGDGGGATNLAGTRLNVNGGVQILAGAGTDTAVIETNYDSGAIAGGVAINLGGGDNQLVKVQATNPGAALAVGGGLSITTAGVTPGGADAVLVGQVRTRFGMAITTGAGDDQLTLDDVVVGGAFALATGGGADAVSIEVSGTPGTSRFRGPVTVRTGDGADVVRVGNSNAADQAVFAVAPAFDGGPGNDTLLLFNFGNELFGRAPAIANFEFVA